MTKTLESFTFNIGGTKLRHETMDGKEYVVAPMAMLTEGVHNGSNGPLFYPKEELSKTPVVWNMKPLVIYHPTANGQGVSACTPEVIEKRSVGVVMNSKFDDKLRAEAWIDEPKCNQVDPRVMKALHKGEMVEVSTGLFTDNEIKEGEYHGKRYVAIARHYRPDHLAILPDKKGACSISDGAGLLQLNEEQLNEAQHDLLGIEDVELPAEELQVLAVMNRDWPQAKRDKLPSADFAGPNQTFPIKTAEDASNAVKLAHHAKDPEAVKRRIKTICKRRGIKCPPSLQNNTTNNMSHGQIREALQQAVSKPGVMPGTVKTAHGGLSPLRHQIEDVYDDFFVTRTMEPDGDKFYATSYEMEPQSTSGTSDPDKPTSYQVKIKGAPKEVKKQYEWRDLKGGFVANMPQEPELDISGARSRFITELKMNGCNTELEQKMLDRMSVDHLALMVQQMHLKARRGANFVAQDSAPATGATGAPPSGSLQGTASVPKGGSLSAGDKLFALRKATGKRKKRKPLNGDMVPNGTNRY